VAHVVPDSIIRVMAENEILPIVIFALFFGIVALIIYNKLNFAFWVSALIAPLVKETLLPLSLVVVIYMMLNNVKWIRYLIFCLIPIFVQAMLRVLFQVKDEPNLDEIYQFRSVFTSPFGLFDSYGLILILLLFIYSKKNQALLISLAPQFFFIVIITSSTMADGKRIWWTIAPFFILAYSNLVVNAIKIVKSFRQNMKSRSRTKV
jgi:Na+/H+-dicarboxylate symporter